MSARHKLNTAFFQGAAVIAGVIGLACGSWKVFFLVLAVLMAGAIHGGDIRPRSGRRQQTGSPRE